MSREQGSVSSRFPAPRMLRSPRHFYSGWLLGYSMVGGLPVGSIFECLDHAHDDDPQSWISAFGRAVARQHEQAQAAEQRGAVGLAGLHLLAAALTARAALSLTERGSAEQREYQAAMERSFQRAMAAKGAPIRHWEIPCVGTALPVYVSDLSQADILFVVVGGSDTYREDLWFCGGQAALSRGYGVLMACLRDRGSSIHQQVQLEEQALETAIRAVRAKGFGGKIVFCGWNGGALTTARYVEMNDGVDAWIASTRISVGGMPREAMPTRLPNHPRDWLQRTAKDIAGRLGGVPTTSAQRHDWEFGPGGGGATAGHLEELDHIDASWLDAPLLALVGTGEPRAAHVRVRRVYDSVSSRHPQSQLIEFTSNGDAYSQANNLPLLFEHIFGWLESLGLAPAPADAHAERAVR